jgi:large conductance mechanosensitive channel
MLKGFKDFVLRGNVIDLSVAVVVGAAFSSVVTAFTDKIIRPLLNAFTPPSTQGFGPTLVAAKPSTLVDFGSLIAAILNFLLVAAVVYFVIVLPMKAIQERRKRGEETGQTEPTDVELLKEIRDLLAGRPDLAAAREQRREAPDDGTLVQPKVGGPALLPDEPEPELFTQPRRRTAVADAPEVDRDVAGAQPSTAAGMAVGAGAAGAVAAGSVGTAGAAATQGMTPPVGTQPFGSVASDAGQQPRRAAPADLAPTSQGGVPPLADSAGHSATGRAAADQPAWAEQGPGQQGPGMQSPGQPVTQQPPTPLDGQYGGGQYAAGQPAGGQQPAISGFGEQPPGSAGQYPQAGSGQTGAGPAGAEPGAAARTVGDFSVGSVGSVGEWRQPRSIGGASVGQVGQPGQPGAGQQGSGQAGQPGPGGYPGHAEQAGAYPGHGEPAGAYTAYPEGGYLGQPEQPGYTDEQLGYRQETGADQQRPEHGGRHSAPRRPEE